MNPIAALSSAGAILMLFGCGTRNFRNENDQLRARVLDLQQQVESLTSRTSELESALAAATASPDQISEAIRANLPYVAEISLSRLSFARDDDGDGQVDAVVLYVQPEDGLGRFTQMTGLVSAHVAILPAGADAITLGRIELDPGALRQAYRSSVTGTHYTIVVPVRTNSASSTAEAIARVQYTDGLSGRVLSAERRIELDSSGVTADEIPAARRGVPPAGGGVLPLAAGSASSGP